MFTPSAVDQHHTDQFHAVEQRGAPFAMSPRRARAALAPILRATLLVSIFAVVVVALASVSGTHRDVASAATTTAIPTAAAPLSGAADVLGAVNVERSRVGLSGLRTDDVLQRGAQQWAEQLAASGSVTHDPQLTAAYGDVWTRMVENLGIAATLDEIHATTLRTKSPHDAILDAKATLIGIGVATGPSGVVLVERVVA